MDKYIFNLKASNRKLIEELKDNAENGCQFSLRYLYLLTKYPDGNDGIDWEKYNSDFPEEMLT